MATGTMTHTDEQLQLDVLEELKWDARVHPNEVGVTVKDGIVTLTGWVDNDTKKWAAEDAAHRVHGVKAVANDIEVRLPSSAERIDADIAAAATRALEWDAFVPIEKLDVTVSKGWITLRGKVVRGYIGVSIQPLMSALAQSLHVNTTEGVLVADVAPGSPAAKAGLKRGDVIVSFNDPLVHDPGQLRNLVAMTAPGTKAKCRSCERIKSAR